ncbi:histone-lysine N-methyltransferase SETMAR-like [Ptiloglossa arizonensis]|uniref:histone-lysine N-methyltransferase SETMAR-like n=1 Tax=Ptiloglossa arizonensis TaxID=3350558 RepID=UPI003F9F0E53
MDVEDETRSGRPIVENDDKIMEIVESDRHASTYSIAREPKISQKIVLNHLHNASLEKKLDVWVPRELTQENLFEGIDACDSLPKCNVIDPFSKRMTTGDEEWVTYENNRRNGSWFERDQPVRTIAKRLRRIGIQFAVSRTSLNTILALGFNGLVMNSSTFFVGLLIMKTCGSHKGESPELRGGCGIRNFPADILYSLTVYRSNV